MASRKNRQAAKPAPRHAARRAARKTPAQQGLFDEPATRARPARGLGWLFKWTLVLAAAGFLALQAWYFAQVLQLVSHNPTSTAFMQAQAEALGSAARPARLKHQWVDIARIGAPLKRAVLVAEDARFVEHFGIDWIAIQRAWATNLEREQIAFGGSTITMQLAKNLYLSGARSYWRKGQEVLIAMMLEVVLSKERILELYLNCAQWGREVFGAQAAAQHYYRTDAARLSLRQASRLAAMLPRPVYYEKNPGSDYLSRRAATIAADSPNVRLP